MYIAKRSSESCPIDGQDRKHNEHNEADSYKTDPEPDPPGCDGTFVHVEEFMGERRVLNLGQRESL